jgi:hypothetical protein
VFTARYVLSPYIKHISFVFKGLINAAILRYTTNYRHSSTYAVLTFRKVWRKPILRKSELSYRWSNLYVRMHVCSRESNLNPHSNTLEPDRPQHVRPAASVTAQQYSSATCVSMRLQSLKEEFGTSFKNAIIPLIFLFLTLRYSRTVCTGVGRAVGTIPTN